MCSSSVTKTPAGRVFRELAPADREARDQDEETAPLRPVAVVLGGKGIADALGQRLPHVVDILDRALDDHHLAAVLQVDRGPWVGGQVAAPAGGRAALEVEPVVDPR